MTIAVDLGCKATKPTNQPNISLRQSILCGYDNVTYFCGRCLICPIVLVVKILAACEAFGPPVKDFALGVSVVIFDGDFVVHILKGVWDSTVY